MIRARLAGPLLRKGEAVNKSETVIKLAGHANRIPPSAGDSVQRNLTIRDTCRAVKRFLHGKHISSFYVQDNNYKFDLSRLGAPTGSYSVSVYAAEGRVLIEKSERIAAEFGGTPIHEKSIEYPGRSTYRVRATRLACF